MQGLLKREQGLQKLHINSSIDHPDRVERGVLRAAGMVERSVDTVTRVTSTEKEILDAKVPLAYRDMCVDLLIPLNACRRKNFYLPWKCEDERHAYELCQYKEYKLRVQQKQQETSH